MNITAQKPSIKSVNPFNNETIKEFDEMTPQEIEGKIALADEAFKTWKKISFAERAKLLHKVAEIIRNRKDELARLITLEMGKLLRESLGEIELSARIFEYYAGNGESFLVDQPIEASVGKAYISYEPFGVHLSVQPWNFPFYQVSRAVAPSIMAGNTLLLKHASNVPQCALTIEEIFSQAGAPKGLYNNLFVRGENIGTIVSDNRVKVVSLTGSEPAGASIASVAGKNIKKSTLELGGSDPFIVLTDADIDAAVNIAVTGRMRNSGQTCISPKRMIVMEEVAEEFEEKAKKLIKALKAGDPLDPETQIAPLSSEKAACDIVNQVEKAVKEGASLIMGGKRSDRQGAFVEPTFLKNIKPYNSAYKEEIFGPVFMLYVVKNELEAIELANATPFGLGGSIFSSDIEKAKSIAKQIDAGMVSINNILASTPELPFGGTKKSGYGRELSPAGIYEFVNAKLIRIFG